MVFILREDRDELKRIVARAFEKQGWTISTPRNASLDIEVSRNSVKFFLQCIDRAALDFNSVSQILSEAEETTRMQASLKKVGVVYIFNFPLMASIPDPLLRGIIAYRLEELDRLTDLDERFANLSFREDKRLDVMASNVLGHALMVSDAYWKRNDLPNAIDWARRAVIAGHGFSQAHRRLCKLLLQVKDYEGAEETMLSGLALQPSNVESLEKLIVIAQLQKDAGKAAAYKRRLESVMLAENQRINNFDELMKRTQGNLERLGAPKPAQAPQSSAASTKPAAGGFLGLFRRKPS